MTLAQVADRRGRTSGRRDHGSLAAGVGLEVRRLGSEGNRADVVEVSAHIEDPIYWNEDFGALARNDSDTVWMTERQSRRCTGLDSISAGIPEPLDMLFTGAAAGRDTGKCA